MRTNLPRARDLGVSSGRAALRLGLLMVKLEPFLHFHYRPVILVMGAWALCVEGLWRMGGVDGQGPGHVQRQRHKGPGGVVTGIGTRIGCRCGQYTTRLPTHGVDACAARLID